MSARKVREVQGETSLRRNEKRADAILKKRISKAKQRRGNIDNALDEEWSESSEEVSSPKRSSRKSYEEDTNQSQAGLTGKRPAKRSFRHSNSVKVHHGGGDLTGQAPVSLDRPKRKALPIVQESVARKQDDVQSRSSLDRAENVLIRKIEDDEERTTRQQLDDIE